MKGGFNKLLRNIVAGASDTEFEKVCFFIHLFLDIDMIAAIDKGNIPS